MLLTQSKMPTRSLLAKMMLLSALLLPLLMLSACGPTMPVEPPHIARKPQPTPLPAALLQIKPQPSTQALQMADTWLQSSGEVLSSETKK